MIGNIGMPELLVIFLFILIFFGSKKIPDIAKGLGQGMREFRKAMKDIDNTIHSNAISDILEDKDSHPAAVAAPGQAIEPKKPV
jgi:sec-independent protein translocase protein TatA